MGQIRWRVCRQPRSNPVHVTGNTPHELTVSPEAYVPNETVKGCNGYDNRIKHVSCMFEPLCKMIIVCSVRVHSWTQCWGTVSAHRS